jgi:hypothetical protein
LELFMATSKKRKKPSPPPSAGALREVFAKHIPYEIIRLVEMYWLLLQPAPYRSGLARGIAKTVDDALIVGFCTHARKLFEFLFRTRYRSYALATDYAEPRYGKLDPKRADVKRLYGQLCAQINHLTYDRTDDDSKKIGPLERKKLVDIIYGEAVRLQKDLQPGYHKQHLHIDLLAATAAMEIKVGAIEQSSAPSSIGGTTSITTSTTPSMGDDIFHVIKR